MSTSLRPDVVAWRDVASTFYEEHVQGDHVAVVGPTDSGKSTLLFEFAKLRARRRARDGRPSRVTVLGTKPADSTLDSLGWPRVTKWPPGYGQEHVMVWPPYGDPATVTERHRRVFGPLLRTIFKEGGQTVVIDEVAYFCEPPPDGLGLRSLVNKYFGVARSNHLSAFGGTTRPAHVPRSMWSEPKWLALFAIYDHDDLRRLVEIGGNTKAIVDTVRELDEHQFLLIRRRGARMEFYVSRVEVKR